MLIFLERGLLESAKQAAHLSWRPPPTWIRGRQSEWPFSGLASPVFVGDWPEAAVRLTPRVAVHFRYVAGGWSAWNMVLMVRAYVGIVYADRLMALLPEGTVDARLIGGGQMHVYFWAALSDEAARQVQTELACGDRVGALHTLDSLAVELAHLSARPHEHTANG